MKIAVFNLREDEREFFEQYSKEYDEEIVGINSAPNMDNVSFVEGCQCMSITTDSPITAQMLDAYQAMGIEFISTRTIGFEHIDMKHATEIGIKAANITYSPSSVADYAIMLMMMTLRKMKHIMYRSLGQDYAISKIRGRELPNMTVGIIGTGKIGAYVAKHLSGFGCKIIAYDPHPKTSLQNILTYMSFDEVLENADIVTLHIPDSEENHHLMNAKNLGKMKKGAILINTARGPLIDSKALIEALESGHLSGAALDVVDGDREIYYRDQKYELLKNHEMAILNAMPNVLLTPHMAFYTDQAVDDMVRNSLKSCRNYIDGKEYDGKLN